MHRIRRADASDVPALCDVLERALANDPFVGWIVGDRPGARARYVRMVLCDLTLPFGEVYTTDERAGAALWAPPGAWEVGVAAQLRILPRVARVVGLRRVMSVARDSALIEQGRPARPYHYLALLGTAPEHRGRGVGRALLEPVLARSDREGGLAVLDTSVEANVRWYERAGFRVTRELSLPRGGPSLWTMIRRSRRAP